MLGNRPLEGSVRTFDTNGVPGTRGLELQHDSDGLLFLILLLILLLLSLPPVDRLDRRCRSPDGWGGRKLAGMSVEGCVDGKERRRCSLRDRVLEAGGGP